MLTAKIYADTWEIDARLEPFGVTRQELIEVVRGVVAARADAVENDPLTAEGLFAYIFGTRFLRSLFRTKGWVLHRQENIESVKHPKRDLKIIYQSVDLAASRTHKPQAVSGKGSGAERVIDGAQGDLFSEAELKAAKAIKINPVNTGAWFFCVSVEGDDVRAELSLPSAVEIGNFKSFIERIFIVQHGEWPDFAKKSVETAPAQFEPVVSRK